MVYYRIGCYYESKGGDLEGRAFWEGGRMEGSKGLIKGVRI